MSSLWPKSYDRNFSITGPPGIQEANARLQGSLHDQELPHSLMPSANTEIGAQLTQEYLNIPYAEAAPTTNGTISLTGDDNDHMQHELLAMIYPQNHQFSLQTESVVPLASYDGFSAGDASSRTHFDFNFLDGEFR